MRGYVNEIQTQYNAESKAYEVFCIRKKGVNILERVYTIQNVDRKIKSDAGPLDIITTYIDDNGKRVPTTGVTEKEVSVIHTVDKIEHIVTKIIEYGSNQNEKSIISIKIEKHHHFHKKVEEFALEKNLFVDQEFENLNDIKGINVSDEGSTLEVPRRDEKINDEDEEMG